jgi:hypothetical protein
LSKSFVIEDESQRERLFAFLRAQQLPFQIEQGPVVKDKTPAQRRTFHRLCGEFGKAIGLTKGQVKELVKVEHFGRDTVTLKNGKVYEVVQSSEEADRPDYSDLIETLLRIAAENGVWLEAA